MPAPLSHIRVLDLSRVLAGPWASQFLADMGAEVIKIERPKSGDDTRGWGPPFAVEPSENDPGISAYFACANRGKKSVTVDIAHPKGQELIRKLAAQSDVVIENFKVGGLAKYGLDYNVPLGCFSVHPRCGRLSFVHPGSWGLMSVYPRCRRCQKRGRQKFFHTNPPIFFKLDSIAKNASTTLGL